jgi:hypothetical protein
MKPLKTTVNRLIVLFFLSLFGCSFLASSGYAHETPIALLKLTETARSGEFKVEWTYASSTNDVPPTAVFPAHCEYDYPTLACGDVGLIGDISLLQLGEKYSAAVIQIARRDAKKIAYTLTGSNPTIMLTPSGVLPTIEVAKAYIPLGFEHIMLGIDHLLFVLGLLFLVSDRWMLIKTITSFTVAHSITLAVATFGWVGVPDRPVNAAIALSIVFLAVEIIKLRQGKPCLSARYPWAIAFGFGLLHGFGFASALTDIGLPPENLPAALLFFNVGVEIGQVGFVLLVLALFASHKTLKARFPKWSEGFSIYAIGSLASFWFITRMDVLVNTV